MGGKTAFCGSPSVHWCTEQRQVLDAPWAGWRMIICWGPRWCKFDPVSRSQRCGTLTMLSDTLQRLCDPVAPAMQENRQKRLFQYFKKKIWLTRDVKVKNGVVLDFKVEHKADGEQLLSLLISLVKILNADFFFGSGVFTCLSISDLALSLEVPVSHTQMAVLVPPVITSFGFGHMAQTIWPHSDRHSYTTSAWRSELD